MGTENSGNIVTESKTGVRQLTQILDKKVVHGVNFKNV